MAKTEFKPVAGDTVEGLRQRLEDMHGLYSRLLRLCRTFANDPRPYFTRIDKVRDTSKPYTRDWR